MPVSPEVANFSAANKTLISAFIEGASSAPHSRLTVASDSRPAHATLAEIALSGSVVAAHLNALGIGPGAVVAVQLPAWSEWLVACSAIARAGAVLLPIVPIYGPKELSFILRQSGAVALITPDSIRGVPATGVVADCGALPDLRQHIVVGDAADPQVVAWEHLLSPISPLEPVGRDPDDLAVLVYTSGTTADPKGVRHSNRTLLSELVSSRMAREPLPGETVLSPWPPGHVAGALTMMRFLVEGTPLVLMDRWDASEAAMLIEREKVTSSSFTPFHLTGLLDAAERDGRDISSLTRCVVGAAPVPASLIERCAERGLRTFRSYGSSEHPTVTAGNADDPLKKRLTTEGRLLPGTEVRFVDDDGFDVPEGAEGEIVTRGPELFTGYHDPELDTAAFLPGGWYRTGDVGRLDADGYLLITDRKKDIVIRGGENISSREVEDVLLGHPSMAEAAVVAAPDPRMGEIVCACIVTREGTAAPTLDELRAWFAAAGIARQKTPERIELLESLPRNATGKVLKELLRAHIRGGRVEGDQA